MSHPLPSPAPGAPCWIDLMSSDVPRSREFYAQVMGWTAAEPSEEFGGYFMFMRDGEPVAGGMAADAQAQVTDVWSVYLRTTDAAATTAAAEASGATVLVPPMPVATLGTMGVLLDNAGAAIGFWQPGDFPGFAAVGVVGAPSWFELHTRDFDGAGTFYEKTFGWRTRPMPDTEGFRYLWSVDGDGQLLSGVMEANDFLPAEVPSHWRVYLEVADLDEALATATGLGATVTVPVVDSPYGRIVLITDPCGAVVALRGPVKTGA